MNPLVLPLLCLGVFLSPGTIASAAIAKMKPASNQACLQCHASDPRHTAYKDSLHGQLVCSDCHQHPLSPTYHQKISRTRPTTIAADVLENTRLKENQLLVVLQQCRHCHESQFSDWTTSRHATTYGDIFLNRTHNQIEPPMNDCLRCHGMFWDATIEDLVAPRDMSGPWHLLKNHQTQVPAIPCLACHQIHPPAPPAQFSVSQSPFARKPATNQPAAFGFYDRREKQFFNASDMPHPKVRKNGEPVAISADARMRNCYQCHSPNATHQSGTSDDRTPLGVHAGLSCAQCHSVHSLSTAQSCSQCHPKNSHCGLEVKLMDTTARSVASSYNIHTVTCADCHNGKRPDASR
jgi:hypothetical protein